MGKTSTVHYLSPTLKSVAGYAPSLKLSNNVEAPREVVLSRPKQMCSEWRRTVSSVMSSVNFGLTAIVPGEQSVGTQHWNTANYLSHGSQVSNEVLLNRLKNGEKTIETVIEWQNPNNADEDDDGDVSGGFFDHLMANTAQTSSNPSGWKKSSSQNHDYVSKYDNLVTNAIFTKTIKSTKPRITLYGCLNDGTSLTVHIDDFKPWVVFQFDSKMTPERIEKILKRRLLNSQPELMDLTWQIHNLMPSDGLLPSKENIYRPRDYYYVYVYNANASKYAENALVRRMKELGAEKVEDAALDRTIRFQQVSRLCPTQWYTITKWEESATFITCTQVEINVKMKDIVPMLDRPSILTLAPLTEAAWDIEQYKDKNGSANQKGLADADNKLNNIICINIVLTRVGNTDIIKPDDPCRQNMPRLEDLKFSFDDTCQHVVTDDHVQTLPDPLAVEEGEKKKRQKLGKSNLVDVGQTNEDDLVEDLKDALENQLVLDEDNMDIDNNDELGLYDDIFGDKTNIMEHTWTLDEDVKYLAETPKLISVGNMDVDDIEMMANSQIVMARAVATQQGTNDRTLNNLADQILGSNLPSKDETLPLFDDGEAESQASKDARHGYELPKWALEKLSARQDLLEKNKTLEAKKKCRTPGLSQNYKFMRRISFFVDPTLKTPSARVKVPALNKDASDGIWVYAYRTEADMLLAVRDFMITVHPDMWYGHFTRSFDWERVFTRANCTLNDNIPVKNRSKDLPIDKHSKYLPILEYGDMLNKHDNPFPVEKKFDYYEASSGGFDHTRNISAEIRADVKQRKKLGKEYMDPRNRKSVFSFMDRFVFRPLHLDRKVTQTNNNGTVESIFPTFHGVGDIDSLIAIRLLKANHKSFKLNYLSEYHLNDSKMDIGIPRMNACYAQKQYWAIIAYCDYDCVLVWALMTVMSARQAHATLARCSYLTVDQIVNYGQQKRFFTNNAIICYVSGIVLVKSAMACPFLFAGGFVCTPIGGIYPVCCPVLDFSSYYVSVIMMFNLCFSTYMPMFDDNLDFVEPNLRDPYEMYLQYRKFKRRLRRLYGVPDRRRRPGALPYYVCRCCGAENFSLVPPGLTYEQAQALPTHDEKEELARQGLQAQLSASCEICAKKPWVKDIDEARDKDGNIIAYFNNELLPDLTSSHDPMREMRYAADYDFLVPRSSACTLNIDQHLEYMDRMKRFNPQNPDEAVMEGVVTEHEEFEWKTDEAWAQDRVRVCEPIFRQEVADKKTKGARKMTEEEIKAVPYVPPIADFALWRPGDFENQAYWIWREAKLKLISEMENEDDGKVDKVKRLKLEALKPLLEVYKDSAADHMIKYVHKKHKGEWNVATFEKYAAIMSDMAESHKDEYFRKRRIFDRTRFDVRCRRGILRYGMTPQNVEKLYMERKAVTRAQAIIKKNKAYYNEDTEEWYDMEMMGDWNSMEATQLNYKATANSNFGALGADTGLIKNRHVGGSIPKICRDYIYYTSYRVRTNFCPSPALYERIVAIRKETIQNADKLEDLTEKYYERFVANAPFPLTPEDGNQWWLKPIVTTTEFRNDVVESLWGISVIYGDTDSIFVATPGLVLASNVEATNDIDKMDTIRRQLGIDIGKEFSSHVTGHFCMYGQKWMEIGFEKMLYCFLAFDGVKKRYAGGYWNIGEKKMKDLLKSWGIKRDMPLFQQKFNQAMIDLLIKTMSPKALKEMIESTLAKLVESGGRIQNLEKDVIIYSKTQAWNRPHYANLAPHYEANCRLARDHPGYEFALGDRIQYVVCWDPDPKTKVVDMTYTTQQLSLELDELKLTPEKDHLEKRINTVYYIGLCEGSVADIYTIVEPKKQFYDFECIHTNLHKEAPWLKWGRTVNILPAASSRQALMESVGLIYETGPERALIPLVVKKKTLKQLDLRHMLGGVNSVREVAGGSAAPAVVKKKKNSAKKISTNVKDLIAQYQAAARFEIERQQAYVVVINDAMNRSGRKKVKITPKMIAQAQNTIRPIGDFFAQAPKSIEAHSETLDFDSDIFMDVDDNTQVDEHNSNKVPKTFVCQTPSSANLSASRIITHKGAPTKQITHFFERHIVQKKHDSTE